MSLQKNNTFQAFYRLFSKQNNDNAQTFENNSFIRYFSFAFLYFAQGVPQGICFYAIPTWLATHSYSPADLGKYAAIVTLPWSLKVFAAPLMDRFNYLAMGKRRPWLLIGQLGIMLTLLFMSFISNAEEHLNSLMLFGFLVSFFGIFQDIAIDGLAIDTLPEAQQARANGLMWGSKIVGIALATVGTSTLLNVVGFTQSIWVFVVVILIIWLIPLFITERNHEKTLPWSKGRINPINSSVQVHSWKGLIAKLGKAFILPSSIVFTFVAFLAGLSKGLIDASLPVLTVQKLNWTNEAYSSFFAISTVVSGLLGMFLGGAIIDKYSKTRTLKVILWSALPIVTTAAMLDHLWGEPYFIRSFMLLFYTLDTMVVIAIFATAMALCWKPIAATQFTIYMALYNLGISLGTWCMGQLKGVFEWNTVLLFYIAPIAVILFLLRKIDLWKHHDKLKNLTVTPISNG